MLNDILMYFITQLLNKRSDKKKYSLRRVFLFLTKKRKKKKAVIPTNVCFRSCAIKREKNRKEKHRWCI
jgi:hypothetical protein